MNQTHSQNAIYGYFWILVPFKASSYYSLFYFLWEYYWKFASCCHPHYLRGLSIQQLRYIQFIWYLLWIFPGYKRGNKNNQQENRRDSNPANLPENPGFTSNHQLDIFAKISESINPHKSNTFPERNP